MKKIVLAMFVLLIAGVAQGTAIYDIQTGAVAENSLVTPCEVVVTATTDNGVFVAEAPYSQYNGIWVYTGSNEPHGMVAGDVVCICGEYIEYYDLSEIDIVAAGVYGSLIKVGSQAVPTPSLVTAADLAADSEPWESCAVTITDAMTVNEILSYGEWTAATSDGSAATVETTVRFDDFWYDADTVMLEDCYGSATGIYYYSFGNFKLEAFADGIELVDCSVATEDVTFGAIKALYR
ncbi:MAG: hypothetical protein GY780_14965 [bacterium]|nr:hypothetical protein [bacterium]